VGSLDDQVSAVGADTGQLTDLADIEQGGWRAGAILVRPDSYIARRHSPAPWDDEQALHLLQNVLTALLSR
jgi:hypothetical protein